MDQASTPRSKKPLTKKQRNFVTALVSSNIDTVAEAGRIAGYCDRQQARKTLQSTTVQNALEDFLNLLDSHGATDHVLAQRIAEGLHATKPNGGDQSPDFHQRFQYVQLICKIKGYLSAYSVRSNDEANKKQLVLVIDRKESSLI